MAKDESRHHEHEDGDDHRYKLLLKALVVARAKVPAGARAALASADNVAARGQRVAAAIVSRALVHVAAPDLFVELKARRALALLARKIGSLISNAIDSALCRRRDGKYLDEEEGVNGSRY